MLKTCVYLNLCMTLKTKVKVKKRSYYAVYSASADICNRYAYMIDPNLVHFLLWVTMCRKETHQLESQQPITKMEMLTVIGMQNSDLELIKREYQTTQNK